MNIGKKNLHLWTIVWGVALFSVIFTVPYQATMNSRSGRDYASYHYAVKATHNNASPYTVESLNKLAREEATRKSVHPSFIHHQRYCLCCGCNLDTKARRTSLLLV